MNASMSFSFLSKRNLGVINSEDKGQGTAKEPGSDNQQPYSLQEDGNVALGSGVWLGICTINVQRDRKTYR